MEWLLCPEAVLGALLTLAGDVCISVSSACHLTSEQSRLDGGGRSTEYLTANKDGAPGPGGWEMDSKGEVREVGQLWKGLHERGQGSVEDMGAGKIR